MRKGRTPRVSRGSGPWTGYAFLTDHDVTSHVGYQIKREYRTDANATYLSGELLIRCIVYRNFRQTQKSANQKSCAGPNGFNAAVDHIKSHEERHVRLARTSWNRQRLIRKLEKISTASGSAARAAATDLMNAVGDQMLRDIDFHTGARTGPFWIWEQRGTTSWVWSDRYLSN